MSDDTGNKAYCVRVPQELIDAMTKDRPKLSIPAKLLECAMNCYGVKVPLPARGVRTRTALSSSDRAVAARSTKKKTRKG